MGMERFFKRPKLKPLDAQAKQAIEKGEAVPTIQTAIENPEMFPYLVNEIRNFSPEDRQKFLTSLAGVEKLLGIADPETFSQEMAAEVAKTAATWGTSTIIGGALFWILFGAGGLNPAVLAGGVAFNITYGSIMSYVSTQNFAKKRDEMHARVVKLKDAVLRSAVGELM